ncbi:RRP15-like protein isoform X2 [Betta splendens]|uniref:RRP15-like protein n=1 Tax=Betta splendens TaxID=158456 RepID=A0A9W2XCJ4_BETSP|nr:RRP15-like protein isoform X2 [Betta splendens]
MTDFRLGEDVQPSFEDYNDQSVSNGGSNDEKDGEEYDGDGDEKGDESNMNAGWAEAMAKILGKKTPERKSSILLRNKQLDKMKERQKQEQLERKKQVDKRQAWEIMFMEKPDIVKNRETERALQRIATRGVVQLFNAVRKHQKTMEHKIQELGGSERKKAKILSLVSKKDFIDVLRRNEGVAVESSRTERHTTSAAEEKPTWSVLTDEFMMGANMKDWDKASDGEETEHKTVT